MGGRAEDEGGKVENLRRTSWLPINQERKFSAVLQFQLLALEPRWLPGGGEGASEEASFRYVT